MEPIWKFRGEFVTFCNTISGPYDLVGVYSEGGLGSLEVHTGHQSVIDLFRNRWAEADRPYTFPSDPEGVKRGYGIRYAIPRPYGFF
jgi:hypothetical protein